MSACATALTHTHASTPATESGSETGPNRARGQSRLADCGAHPEPVGPDNTTHRILPQDARAQPTAVLFFSGPKGRIDGIDTTLEAWGWKVHMVDVVNGPGNELTDPLVREGWARRIRVREFHCCGFAPVCTSFSRLHQPPVRDGVSCELLDPHTCPRGSETAQGRSSLGTTWR